MGSKKPGMRRPNLFIVGAPRCGTTSLWSYLGSHPEIFMAREKELYFFSQDLRPPDHCAPSLDEYLRHFARARGQKKVGEATPDYLRSELAPKAIKAFSPAAQIIIMLRNPVDVMYSLFSEARSIREPMADFEAALVADAKRTGRQLVGYRQFTDYPEQVQRFFDVFGPENVHIVIYDDLKDNTAEVYRDTLRFLGVDPSFVPEFRVLSASVRARSKRLQKLLAYPPRALRLTGRVVVPRAFRPRLRQALESSIEARQPRPPMDPELRMRLQREFAPKIDQLSKLLGRDLSGWSKG